MSQIETLTNNAANNGEITLTVDEQTRTLKYEGELLLGVENDYQAERIHFEFPQIVGDDIDLSADTVKIYIDFKNAFNEPYIYECIDKTATTVGETTTVNFSWLLPSQVTESKGTVEFTVCIKNYDTAGTLVNEWHTSPFKGTVVKGIDVSEKGNEIIHDEVVSTNQLKESVDALTEKLSDVNAYIDEQVTSKVTTEVETKHSELEDSLTAPENPLIVAKAYSANTATKATQDGNGAVIADTYLKKTGSTALDLKISDKEGVVTVHFDPDTSTYEILATLYAAGLLVGPNDEVILDPSTRTFTILGKKILTAPTVEDVTALCRIGTVYNGTLTQGGFDNYALADEIEKLPLSKGDKVRLYLRGTDSYLYNNAIMEVELATGESYENDDGTITTRYIGRSSLTIIRDNYNYQNLIISVTVNYLAPYTTILMGFYALTDSYKEAYSTIEVYKVEVVRAQ